jgi:hypothetical protein
MYVARLRTALRQANALTSLQADDVSVEGAKLTVVLF